ncbi:MAG: hypothetical protein KJZ59_01655 [Pararhodobacter sp.]|nr:hypothetical protein [Pararhodobacter sp.]
MAQPLRLEVFETPETPDGPVFLMPEQVEDIRLNAYERGYLAGWEDGANQSEADETTRRAAIARQVEQLSFTYHEARSHVLRALRPVFEAMVASVLPAAARASIIPLTIEHLLPLAQAAADEPVTLRVATGSLAAFEAAFEGLVLPPMTVVATDDLAEGQAEFEFGAMRSSIDLDHAADTIRRAIDSFYQIQIEESRRA